MVLTQERAALSIPAVEVREVEKAVIPPEVTAKLAQLQAQVQTVTEQRENLARKAAQLGADLATLRDTTQAEREREVRYLRIRQHWREATVSSAGQHLPGTLALSPGGTGV